MRVAVLLVAVASAVASASVASASASAVPSAGATASPAADSLPTLTLHAFLTQMEDHLIAARRVALRRIEAQAEVDHLRYSRAFEVEVEGNYRSEDNDRLEVNGNKSKRGRSRDVRRGLTFSLTRPLLGRSLEQRLLAASEQQRLVELGAEETVARREDLLDVIELYVDLAAEQRHRPFIERAVMLASEKLRVHEARRAQGESLGRDVLAAAADLARWRAEQATAERKEVEFFAELAARVDGEPPAPFRAAELEWSRMLPPAGEPETAGAGAAAGRPGIARRPATRSGVWYNLPEVDLRLFYNLASRDRDFLDERDLEQGHTPGIEVKLAFPLDAWRSGRSFARQVAARAERQRLGLVALERQTAGRERAAALAHEEAAARVAAAEAELALRVEERRVKELRAGEQADSASAAVELNVIEAELKEIEARAQLAKAQGELARRYFERAMIAGEDPKQLALALESAPAAARAGGTAADTWMGAGAQVGEGGR